MSSSSYRTQAPPTLTTDGDYDYAAAHISPTRDSASGLVQMMAYSSLQDAKPLQEQPIPTAKSGDEALLDLAQLEELQEEAELMKALGNKHMAAQEFTRAYNAYSAALQLAPVGPSSHVFLSNRAAALLSLKRYQAAATDARRAIALAPTFGKAHARLGQALYFLKDYAGAIHAYQDALHFEPDNDVTRTYLVKAQQKLERHNRKERGEEVSVAGETQLTPSNSILTTDPQAQANAVVTDAYSGNKDAMNAAVMASPESPQEEEHDQEQHDQEQHEQQPQSGRSSVMSNVTANSGSPNRPSVHAARAQGGEEDPEFEAALEIQRRANAYLTQKKYKSAIEEYTAALFLVPDDPNMSPDLHLGRAHALNGSRRHESARNDCMLAIKLNPSPAAYSTLAKSLFYMQEYEESIKAFNDCIELLPPGESLGMFDQAYYEKAEVALAEMRDSLSFEDNKPKFPKSPVPKLPPPRFVPREQAIHSTAQVPPMPKQWPQQSPVNAPLKVGPERSVYCLSESLGIKLNRGSDGIVRILSVNPDTGGSPTARKGSLAAGDVLREVAGVDLRRPLTNIMWGDTVALIKMAPRPIVLVVAQELSPVPLAVLEEQRKIAAAAEAEAVNERLSLFRQSPSSGDEAVQAAEAFSEDDSRFVMDDPKLTAQFAFFARQAVEASVNATTTTTIVEREPNVLEKQQPSDKVEGVEQDDETSQVQRPTTTSGNDALPVLAVESGTVLEGDNETAHVGTVKGGQAPPETRVEGDQETPSNTLPEEVPPEPTAAGLEDNTMVTHSLLDDDSSGEVEETRAEAPTESMREREERMVGGEILFARNGPPAYCGWDSLRWMAYSGARRVQFCQKVYRLVESDKKKIIFWQTNEEQFVERALLIYEEPSVVLVVRRPNDVNEVMTLLDIQDVSEMVGPQNAVTSFWVVESVADPATAKLHLSPLTTVTMPYKEKSSERSKSCFTILTPVESIVLSAVRVRDEVKRKSERSFSDSGAFLETMATETALSKALYSVHEQHSELGSIGEGIVWKHQLVLGTLHSFVVSGNHSALEEAIASALKRAEEKPSDSRAKAEQVERIVDAVDDNGLTALYYACSLRMSGAVATLIKAGANVNLCGEGDGSTLLHVCARNLDDKSLSTVLSAGGETRLDANALTSFGHTPMYIAAVEGRSSSGAGDSSALRRCLTALKAWGGEMKSNTVVKNLAVSWRHDDLLVVLETACKFRYPLPSDVSLSAFHLYPVHHALISLLGYFGKPAASLHYALKTLRILLDHGFEPNERFELAVPAPEDFLVEFVGYTPLQILGSVAVDLEKSKELLDPEYYAHRASAIADLSELIVRMGGRLAVDAPPTKRLRQKLSTLESESGSDVGHGRRASLSALTTKQLSSLLGGEERMSAARKCWTNEKSVGIGLTTLMADDKSVFADSESPGGSDDKSCALCWKAFGTLRNRKHKCRVSRRYVCDDCSSKRLVDRSGAEHRISDGQFLLAKADEVRKESLRMAAELETESERLAAAKSARALNAARASRFETSRTSRIESVEQSNRDSLFGGMLEQATNFVFGDDEESKPADTLRGLNQSLNETRDALNERGEKLASLDEKTSELVNASADFAKMAKELRMKSEGGFFW